MKLIGQYYIHVSRFQSFSNGWAVIYTAAVLGMLRKIKACLKLILLIHNVMSLPICIIILDLYTCIYLSRDL